MNIKQNLKNIYQLSIKEIYGLLSDKALMILIMFVFTVVTIIVYNGIRNDLNNASIAIIDSDKSHLSYIIQNKIRAPYFKAPKLINIKEIYDGMDNSKYIFVLDIPPNFQNSVLENNPKKIQLLIDGTALPQALSGLIYLQTTITESILNFMNNSNINNLNPIKVKKYLLFNENAKSQWLSAINQIVLNINLLAILLVGAAVIREKEKGTIEHLLVMPVSAIQIALAKIISNGSVILIAVLLSMIFIIKLYLKIPIQGSLILYSMISIIYIFTLASLGMLIATLTPTMPQFGLIITPLLLIIVFTSGGATPVNNMPILVQFIVKLLPTTEFLNITRALIFKGVGINMIYPAVIKIAITGLIFFGLAFSQLKKMLERQG